MSFKTLSKREAWQWALRIALTAACVAMLVFIFSNSLKTGEQSTRQSTTMAEVVQNVASVIAPNSGVANATGEAFDRLHVWVRAFAHFAEFAVFGSLLLWCISSYTWKKEGLWFALVGVCCVPMLDEALQYFVADRGAEFRDVCIDVSGGVCGVLFALVVLMVMLWAGERRRRKRGKPSAERA